MYRAHVEAEFESSHANGPDGHKCQAMHGHSWKAEVSFTYGRDNLDRYGWGPDFGAVKALIRRMDHRNLNDLFSFPPSAENIAEYLWNEIASTWPYVRDLVVTIHEGGGNSITCTDR